MTSSELLARRDWEVRTMTMDDARRLVQSWHYAKGYRTSAIYVHGLFRVDDGWFGAMPWGAAVWMNGVMHARRFGTVNGAMVLARLVVAPEAPKNAASFLLSKSMRLIDRKAWPVLMTYADSAQGHTGAIYRATNWQYDGIGGALTYVNPATGEQRSSLGGGSHFEPCPVGWEVVDSPKHRFIHVVPYERASAASSDAPGNQPGEGGSQPTPTLQLWSDQ
jgi:hypothetical protein